MKNKILEVYLKIFSRNSFRNLNRFFLIMGLKGLGITNYQGDIISGEKFALEEIKKIVKGKNLVFFDVGANIGDYSLMLREIFGKDAEIYSFEPVKNTFEELKKKSNITKNKIYNIGFSSEIKELNIYYSKNESQSPHASLYGDVIEKVHEKKSVHEKIKLDKIDNFCKNKSIDNIDFLKIDVEGAELDVLKGANKMIDSGKIKIIQFEFNEMNLISKTNMLDFFKILKNYKLYRILTKGLAEIRTKDIENRLFLFQNIIAIRK